MKAKLLLFDVDGTLIRTPAGRLALENALNLVFGIDKGLDGIPMMGHTDLDIVQHALERHGLAVPDNLEPLWRQDEAALRTVLEQGCELRVLPGVERLLEAAATIPDLYLGLVTGNARSIARAKLDPVGLWRRFPVGAFGDEHRDRAELIRMAQRRAHDTWGVTPAAVALVGDTPRDVRAAKRAGVHSVAVASGYSTVAELTACEPDLVLPDLSARDTLATIEGILGEPGSDR